jgi:signal transduction histidine kinase
VKKLVQRIRQSSSYQVGLLFAALIGTGMAFAAYLLWLAGDGATTGPDPDALSATLTWVGASLFLVLLLILVLSYGVAYYVGTRFERIAATTRRIIATGNLRERLPVDSSWDDLSKLAVLLNTMLAELEHRVDGIKAVSDNIAHDLRTPLMRLRTSIEELEHAEKRVELLAELDQTLGIFNSLLRISAIEAGQQPLASGEVDLDTLIADAAALYEPVATERDVVLQVEAGAPPVVADRDLLFQALANLIDNAVKFSPAGGTVRISAATGSDRVTIRVADQGPGIPEQDRERVLTRFQRLDASRSTPGNGLGLPLVLAIAQRHGGSLSLRDAQPAGGLCVAIHLPLRSPDRGAA